jgi:hypothetical protein
MPRAIDVKPGTALARAMFPSLGFFGGTWADCLALPYDGTLTRLRVERASKNPGFLNLKGILLRKNRRPAVVDDHDLKISQSSDRPESNLPPQGVTKLTGIHTLKEVGAWWQVENRGGVLTDQILIFNRPDGMGIRSRELRVTAWNDLGQKTILYDSTSPDHLRETLRLIEHFVGGQISDTSIDSVARARQWRSDTVGRIAELVRRGELRVSARTWIALAALLPTKRGRHPGDDLEGSDWLVLAYGLCSQLQRDARSRSGVQAYARVLDSVERLDRLEVEFDRATTALGTPPMHHVRHGIEFRGQLRDRAPQISEAVEKLSADLRPEGLVPLLAYGSLLGAVREGHLLDHDDDFDIFVTLGASTEEEFQERRRAMHGALEARGWTVELNGKFKNSHIWNGDEGPKLDLFSVWDDGVVAWTHMEKMKWRSIPRKWFLDHSPIEVDGIRMEASEHAPEFLEERYGPNWRTPDKYHDWRWPLNG